MQRFIVFITTLVAFSCGIGAQGIKQIDISEEGELVAYVTPKLIYMVYDYDKKYTIIDRKNLRYDKDGFLKLSYLGADYLILDGEKISQYFTDFKNDGENIYDDDLEGFHDYNLQKIEATSFFTEVIAGKQVKYTPDNLYKAFLIGCKCHPYWWNTAHIPWVEGAAGNGIGESITITYKKPVTGISILNGYVDINNLKLYKENSRLKTVTIKDAVNKTTQTIAIDDEAGFKFVKLDKPTTTITIIIDEVYEGTKYQDTCVSAILDHQVITENAYRSPGEIEKRLNKIIKDYKRTPQ